MVPSPEIPKTQKAVVVDEFGDNFKVKVVNDYPVPEPGQGQVLVRLTSSGVCHSDLAVAKNYLSLQATTKILGHEGSGYIVKHGEGVDAERHPIGEKVGVPLISGACHDCEDCEHDEVYCKNNKGFYGSFIDGTWQQYIIVRANMIVRVPEQADTTIVGPILCGGVTVYKALKRAGLTAGSWVVITGAGGGLGSLAIQYAIAMGLRPIAIDTGADKEKLVKKLGAEVFVDFAKDNIVEKINEVTGGGAHGAIMIAPVVQVYSMSVAYVRNHGTIVCVGLPKSGQKMEFEPAAFIFKALKLVGTLVGNRQDCREALDFMARGKVAPAVEKHKMEDIQEILNRMQAGDLPGRAVIDLN